MMYRVGLSSCGKEINDALFEAYNKAGIAAMEISAGKDWYDTADYKKIKEMADLHGVELWSLHLPFGPFHEIEISSLDESLRLSSLKRFSQIIRQASAVGINKFVIHASGEPIPEEERRARMETSKRSLSELAAVAAECGSVLAVENLPRTCLGNCGAEMKELISASPDLRVCFDTNHLLMEDFEVLLSAVGDKLITVHVSDYDFVDEKHWLPGEGKMDWTRLIKTLEKTGYQGPWLYEIGFGIPKSFPRSRRLTCEDFANNARELFEGKPVTII